MQNYAPTHSLPPNSDATDWLLINAAAPARVERAPLEASFRNGRSRRSLPVPGRTANRSKAPDNTRSQSRPAPAANCAELPLSGHFGPGAGVAHAQ